MTKPIITGSDFCGVGAFDQALELLGIVQNKMYACDMDKFARQTYCLNYGTEKDVELSKSVRHGQICDQLLKCAINGIDPAPSLVAEAEEVARQFSFYFPMDVYLRSIPETPLDIYMTSPPCQAFSMAGKRKGKDDHKGILFFNSLEFIQKNRPRVFVFENVEGLLSHDKVNNNAAFGRTFNEWVNYLGGKSVNGNQTIFPYDDAVPYHIYHKVINAKHFGVAQNRPRVFIIGIRDDADNHFHWPKKSKSKVALKDVLENEVDEKYFLSKKTIEGFINHSEKHKERGNGFSFTTNELDKEARAITTKAGSRQTDNFVMVAREVRTEKAKAERKLTGTNGFRDREIEFAPQTVIGTITTQIKINQVISVNDRIRKLTPRECFRCFGFPDSFKWDVSDGQAYKQAGNSIAREPLAAIISKVLKLDGNK